MLITPRDAISLNPRLATDAQLVRAAEMLAYYRTNVSPDGQPEAALREIDYEMGYRRSMRSVMRAVTDDVTGATPSR